MCNLFKKEEQKIEYKLDRKLSKYFTYDEMVKSDYAIRNNIDNTPNLKQIENLTYLCNDILDKIREHYNSPTIILSGFRSPKLNKGIGGYKKSQHMEGEAADFIVLKNKTLDVWKWIAVESGLDFDCCIAEFIDNKSKDGGWIHLSYRWNGANRKKLLTARKVNGKTIYERYTINDVINNNFKLNGDI